MLMRLWCGSKERSVKATNNASAVIRQSLPTSISSVWLAIYSGGCGWDVQHIP
jgi:hypothetical protein